MWFSIRILAKMVPKNISGQESRYTYIYIFISYHLVSDFVMIVPGTGDYDKKLTQVDTI